jgi:ribulose-phosphate 3-epimerase
MNTKIISPSILSCDFLNIEKEISYFSDFPDIWMHLDVMDGHFVPNLTFGHEIISKISKKTNIPLDAHCMVSNPEFFIETFKDFNLKNFTFHLEACNNSLDLVLKAKKLYPMVGISIKPKTIVSEISDEILKEIDLVLVMSVEPGFGGQKFMENAYEKINQLKVRQKQLHTTFQIQVDGGVSNQNAKKLFECGATNLVAGSYIFKAGPDNYGTQIESLRR